MLTHADGEPLGRQTVRIQGIWDSEGENRQALAEADGTFGFEVSDGTYWLLVLTAAGSACTVAGSDDPSAVQQDVITVSGGAITGLELVVSGAPATAPAWLICAEAQASGNQFSGFVVDEEGRPVEGLLIAALAAQGGQGRTEAGGAFRLQLVDGTYRLYISSDTYDRCTVSGIENPDGLVEAVLTLEGENVTSTRIVVVAGARKPSADWVRCHFDVPSYRVQGTVRGPDQRPLAGIDVRLQGSSGDGHWTLGTGERTGSDGTFTIEAPAGSYLFELAIETAGGEVCRLGPFGTDGRRAEPGETPELVVSNAAIAGIDLTLTEKPATLCHQVAGVVTDARGNPLADLSLNFTGYGRSDTTTDEAGRFRLHLQEGSYRLWIRTDLGSDCRIEGYAGEAPGRGNSIRVDGGGAGNLRLVLFGAPRPTVTTEVKCPYPEIVTTELEPGWNLAGWTGPQTSTLQVFEATPQLEAIYAWSAETQSFRGAVRQEPGGHNALETLEPGMGLWIFVEGTERVNWTRPLVAESALVSLADGWNLVSWGGHDGATADDIFSSLGAEPVVAAVWDASRGAFLRASTATPADAPPGLQVRRGDALWLQTSGREGWLQPGWPAPDVVLAGDPHHRDNDGYLQLVREAQAFYADRYGVITSEVTFYFVADREAFDDTYRLVRGNLPPAEHCADSGSEVIFIATYVCFPIAHEYFHSIQQALSGNNYLGSPTWIVEGSFYTDYEQRYSKGEASTLPILQFLWATYGPQVTLETESSYWTESTLGQIAFEWYAGEVGEEAITDYFALLKTSDTWDEAFQRAFGLAPDDFYAAFEDHRREVAPPFEWVVTGTVLDREAQPVEGIEVGVIAQVEGVPVTSLLTPTGPDGSFAIEHAPGSGYALLLIYQCPDGSQHDIGGHGQGGFTTDGRNAPPFTGEDRDRRGLTISIPVALAEFERENCAR
ncbi:MAG: carboxypeptidase-like regulatory domain-containing protein [bacterium]|nr:carboxypeptidase-like regulatory domain-containing protein [bacterium]